MAINLATIWQKYGKYLTILPIVLALIVIWTWPQKTGDVRTDSNGNETIYWRGPSSDKPGEWLPKDTSVAADAKINGSDAIGSLVGDKKVIDCVKIGGGKAVVVLEIDGVRTARIMNLE